MIVPHRRGCTVGHFQDDRYLVFVRVDAAHGRDPAINESPLAECDSYEEARQVKFLAHCDCVIRFVGNVGGGD
jgi:hypothetical protein